MINKAYLIIIINVLFSSFMIAQEFQIDFPLQIGNRWQYSEFPGIYGESSVICDTVMSNGLTYSKIEGPYFNGYFRKEGVKVYSFYETLESKECEVDDFFLNVGDTVSLVSYPGGYTFSTTIVSKGVKNIFGQERNYITFFRDEITSSLDGNTTIVDGLGVVQYFGELMFYECTGAIIDGVQYGEIVGIQNGTNEMPTNFLVNQNYPNPFNPTTTITYQINKPGYVRINIYDSLGNQFETLLNEYQNTGIHQVTFNANNLSSGVYFYTIVFNNIIKTKSMVLVK